MNKQELLRLLPRVDDLIHLVKSKNPSLSNFDVTNQCRLSLDNLRSQIVNNQVQSLPNEQDLALSIVKSINEKAENSLRQVINATGVVLHTNLGRARLAQQAAENVKKVAMSYSTLEYDLQSGERGSRHSHAEKLICDITGAEAAIAVNNNAAAVMLTLSSLCGGGEVVVSRGELVEIGGSFRIPDIMSLSGAILKEVGTTNKTKLTDYQNAIGDKTCALLKVHTSNFKIVGFSEEVDIKQLGLLSKQHNIPLIYDLGSGLMFDSITDKDLKVQNLCHISGETSVSSSIKEGADVVCFSGDKLFGGPQAGIIIGKKEYIQKIKSNQLARVVRIDKLTLAALESTLKMYLNPDLHQQIPTLRDITQSLDGLKVKANSLKKMLSAGLEKHFAKSANPNLFDFVVKQVEGQIGGGSAPGQTLPSFAVEVSSKKITAIEIEKALRFYKTPIVARINKGCVLLDVRTIEQQDFAVVVQAFTDIASSFK